MRPSEQLPLLRAGPSAGASPWGTMPGQNVLCGMMGAPWEEAAQVEPSMAQGQSTVC